MSAEDDAVAACRMILAAREARRRAIERRDAAWLAMVAEGVPRSQVGPRFRARLEVEGFTAEEIAEMGVSDGNVRLALERPRT